MNESKHAAQIVRRFRQQIGEECCQTIGNEQLAALELMIESAIDASVLEAIRHASEISAKASQDILHIAERF